MACVARSVAMVASYVPRRCGIATFTHDLSSGMSEKLFRQPIEKCRQMGIVAINDVEEGYKYGEQVVFEIRHHSKEDYRAAADYLNQSKFEVVCVQHEYGIFGGNDGDYLLALLQRLHKPVIAVLHTVLADPSPGQRRVLAALCERAGAIVVMAERAKRMLAEVFGISGDHVVMIHHGVPDVPFGPTEPFKKRFEVAGRPTILTFGLINPNKGIEMMLNALARVVPDHPDVAYIVLGATHPAVKRESGESYRLGLEKLALTLGIQRNVMFHNRYVSLEDLCEYLRATDIYVTPYRSENQIVSGTLAYAAACGTAVISTPYWYAQEILADGRGRIVDFGDVAALARHLDELLRDEKERLVMRRRAYAFGRMMTWPNVALEYAALLDKACERWAAVATPAPGKTAQPMRLSLPEVRLDHLYRMTDDTGITQHASFSTPNRHHGYSIDDVSRALIVTAMRYVLFHDDAVLKCLHTYLSFVHHARRSNRRFHNFMSYDRRWSDVDGGDDAQGRVLWALGFVAAYPPDPLARQHCRDLFLDSLPGFDRCRVVRSLSFAMLGCHYFLMAFPDESTVESRKREMAGQVVAAFEGQESDDWPWFADVVTYENARVPQALLMAGEHFHDRALIERGLRVLDWLLRVQTGDDGQLSLIGCKGWMERGKARAPWDQQPVEVAALIGACKAAYHASDDPRYLREMRRCFDWFLGYNDLGLPMIDFKSRGCYDALTDGGVNLNQGAESLISWLLSLLTMHELQTGEAEVPA